MDLSTLEQEALRLPVRERAPLADALLGSLDVEADRACEAAWLEEAESRFAAYRRGEIEAVDGARSLAELRAAYRT